MTILHPIFIWLMPLAGVFTGLASWARARRTWRVKAYLEGHTGAEYWPDPGRTPTLPGFWRVRTLMLVLAGLLLALALARPSLRTREVPVLVPAKPLVLLLDVSSSMAVRDVPLGRLGAARILVRRIVSRLPASPIGLMVFAGEAHTLLPPSFQRSLLLQYLDSVDPEMLTRQGTSLSAALKAGLSIMRNGSLEEGTVFLLLSDGEHHDDPGEILSLVAALRDAGGRMAALSLGTPEGGSVPVARRAGLSLMSGLSDAETENGMPHSRSRPDVLAQLAGAGGGTFAHGEKMEEVYALLGWLDAWGTVGDGVALEEVPVEAWPWILALALGLLMLESALELPSRWKEAPWR